MVATLPGAPGTPRWSVLPCQNTRLPRNRASAWRCKRDAVYTPEDNRGKAGGLAPPPAHIAKHFLLVSKACQPARPVRASKTLRSASSLWQVSSSERNAPHQASCSAQLHQRRETCAHLVGTQASQSRISRPGLPRLAHRQLPAALGRRLVPRHCFAALAHPFPVPGLARQGPAYHNKTKEQFRQESLGVALPKYIEDWALPLSRPAAS